MEKGLGIDILRTLKLFALKEMLERFGNHP
jgi:hypothetical protein